MLFKLDSIVDNFIQTFVTQLCDAIVVHNFLRNPFTFLPNSQEVLIA